jgi:hypothetical protein
MAKLTNIFHSDTINALMKPLNDVQQITELVSL